MKNWMLLALCVTGATAFAVDWSHSSEAQGYIGVQGGLSVPSQSSTNARGAFGVKGGAKVSDNLGFGAYYLNAGKNENNSTYGKFDYAAYGIEGDYYFDGSGGGAYVGINLGLSKVSTTSGQGVGFDYSPFVYGVQGGYDLDVVEHFSLGIEAQALFIGSGSSSSGNQSQSLSSFTALNLMLQAKAWF